ncbi:UNVERIFIED_CONTAM: hypothetical protein Sradi_0155300 [Sesamum radiatum]|uniref:Uncharacterized protein n=1 Tax=Sesamum radiatum TaxID=300843 RepID=A0AAW2WJV8_SESRA
MEAIFGVVTAVFVKQTIFVPFHPLRIFPHVERPLDYPLLFCYGKDLGAGGVQWGILGYVRGRQAPSISLVAFTRVMLGMIFLFSSPLRGGRGSYT